MARTDNLTNFLTDVAEAIKTKKGDSTSIKASDFDTEIENLPSGGGSGDVSDYFHEEITVNTSTTYTIPSKIMKKCPNITIKSSVTNLSYAFLNSEIISIPAISGTENVTNMSSMFSGCKSLIEIPSLDTSKVTNMSSMFSNCTSLTEIPSLDTSKVTNMSSMFSGCTSLIEIPSLDTSSVTTMYYMFLVSGNSKLQKVPKLNASKVVDIRNFMHMYNGKNVLTDFGGLENLGEAYLTTQSTNYTNYKLDMSDLTSLTHDSLMNVINNLYDIATKGCNTQQLVLGTTNMAKLTADEIAIATNKGWTVS